MTENEMTEFGNAIMERLKSEEPVEDIAKDFEAKVSDVPPELFQAFARILVDNSQGGAEREAYRLRLQRLNVLAVKMEGYTKTIERFHTWKNAQPASDPR